jgi:hypothetical protein
MKFAILLPVVALLLPTQGFCIDRMVEGFPDLPKDARSVAERYMGCQHFWGEVNGTGDERDKEVAKQLKELGCNEIEQEYAKIKHKYRNNATILKILNEAIFVELPN